MITGTWRANRPALIAGALALLAGTPAILTVAGVRNPWILAGTTAGAAVIVVFSAVWQERYRRVVQRRDEHAFRVQEGCLVLADGQLPVVRDITDPVILGVHQATAPADVGPSGRTATPSTPTYVPRDVDDKLRELLAAGGFVLLVGDSTAGKSRAAFEAVSGTLTSHVLICPSNRDAIAVVVERAAQERRCVLWLDDLERYLGAGGLTAAQVGRLVSGQGHHRVIVATIRAAEQVRLIADAPRDDVGRQASHDIRRVLDQAHSIRVARMFTDDELGRARVRDWDPRIAEAIDHADSYGIAEYLAAGPELLRDWQNARASSEGLNARGAALVAAAIDIRRAGYTSAIPRALLDQVHEHFLDDPEHAHIPFEPVADAWEWATRQRQATTALLRPVKPDLVEVFDYLVDTVQRHGSLGQVPRSVVLAAIDFAGPADSDSLAFTAYAERRYSLAEHAYRQAYQAKAIDPAVGPNHPDALVSRNNLARAIFAMGRLEDAETETRAVLEITTRELGPEDPDTLTSRSNVALILDAMGRREEAETETRAILRVRTRVLGPEDPDTLSSRINLGLLLANLGRAEEAETENRAVLEITSRAFGPDHALTLASRGNLADNLNAMGRLGEAETEIRLALAAESRAFGPDHPYTLASRNSLARILADLGRLDEAETESRMVLEAMTRVLGPRHPQTLASRSDLARVIYAMERLEEAKTEQAPLQPERSDNKGGE
jgi:tetratricopeptide (TPR) repeat protein